MRFLQGGSYKLYLDGILNGGSVWNLQLTYEIQYSGEWLHIGCETMASLIRDPFKMDCMSSLCAKSFLTGRKWEGAAYTDMKVLVDRVPFETQEWRPGPTSQS